MGASTRAVVVVTMLVLLLTPAAAVSIGVFCDRCG
jgi:hypothetical protein